MKKLPPSGASYQSIDGMIYFPFKLDPIAEVALSGEFDAQVNHDIQMIEKAERDKKYLKKFCLYKIIMYPMDYTLVRILFGKSAANEKKKVKGLCLKLLRDKIDTATFKKNLQSMIMNGEVN